MSREAMAKMVLKKGKKKFVYRQTRYLSYLLKRMLCNTSIQLHYDFACCSWYPNLSKSLKTKLQATQNSCVRYCLRLKDIHIEEPYRENQIRKNKLATSFK